MIQHYSTEGIFESEVRMTDDPRLGGLPAAAHRWTERRVRVAAAGLMREGIWEFGSELDRVDERP